MQWPDLLSFLAPLDLAIPLITISLDFAITQELEILCYQTSLALGKWKWSVASFRSQNVKMIESKRCMGWLFADLLNCSRESSWIMVY